jgi:hypothetical protein
MSEKMDAEEVTEIMNECFRFIGHAETHHTRCVLTVAFQIMWCIIETLHAYTALKGELYVHGEG